MSGFWDDSMALPECHGRIRTERSNRGVTWYHGEVLTPRGIVTVYSDNKKSRLDFAHQGRLHMRNFRRGLTKRGLAILAGRFAREIVGTRP